MAAVNTDVTAQNGNAGIPGKVVLFQRLINFATTNLTHTDWFDLFQTIANTIVLGGQTDLVLTGTASATFDVGVEAGAELLSATALDTTTGTATAFTHTAPVSFDATTIDLSVNDATAILGQVRITVVVALCGVL